MQSQAEDITCLIFWLYNTTAWLHLMQCDNLINEACEMIGSFEMIEEVINSAFGSPFSIALGQELIGYQCLLSDSLKGK
jgi:hypothetical protein